MALFDECGNSIWYEGVDVITSCEQYLITIFTHSSGLLDKEQVREKQDTWVGGLQQLSREISRRAKTLVLLRLRQ